MKICLLFFILFFNNSFSQEFLTIDPSTICDSTITDLFNEFSTNAAYAPEEARQIGTQKANCDLANGTRNIIIYSGMFTSNFCEQCFYSDLGFTIEKKVKSDVIYDRDYSYQFVNGYNERMNSLLDSAQLAKLKNLTSRTNSDSFIFDLINKSQFNGSKINDTLIRIQLKNEELENLFPSDFSRIKLTLKIAYDDSSKRVYTYSQLKDGIKFPFQTSNNSRIIIGYNFEEVPYRMEICWCKFIEKEFQRSVKITFK